MRWWMVVGELAWAIELIVMYHRWCAARSLEPEPDDVAFFRQQYIKMCVRLGDDAAHRILKAKPGAGRIVDEGDQDG